MSGHVFISHGSEDRDAATAMSSFLEAHGVKTWIAPRDVRPGTDYSEALQEAIEGCAAFVVLVTATSNKSPYVRAETEMAFSTGKPIFPVRKSDIKPAAGLALFLKIRHWTDAYGASADAAMDRLALELQTLTGVTPQAQAPAPAEQVATMSPPVAPPPPPPPPPASQQTAPAAPLPSPGSPDEERWRAAIGPNADYYLGRWRKMDASGRVYSWNWPACLANFVWLAWRKMWLWLAGFIVASLVLSAAAGDNWKLSAILNIALTFATGYFCNHLYRKQIARLVGGTADMSQAAAIENLRARGGTSMPALVVCLVLVGLALFGTWIQVQRQMAAGNALAPASQTTAPAATGGKPTGASTGEGSQPAPPAGLDRDYLVGRWTDDGNCSNAYEFASDGTFVSADGQSGNWALEGDRLVVTGNNGSASIQVSPVDHDHMSGTGPQGQLGTSTRC